MLTRLFDWNRRRKQWNRDHHRAWAGHDIPDTNGLSAFQAKCEDALIQELERRGLGLEHRVVEGSTEPFVHARIGDRPFEVWIYLDQAQISGPSEASVNLEKWDARTPQELIEKFISHVQRALDGPN